MSESTNSGAINDSNAEGSTPEAKVVPVKAYEDVNRDMHKYKSKVKDYEAKIAQYEADKKAKEEATLAETQQFQKLWEEEKKRRAELENRLSENEKRFVQNQKKLALKSALGNIKDEYLVFADLESIESLEDGSLNPDSIHKAANDFRAKHPQLIVKNEGSNITGKAPAIDSNVPGGQVDLSKMSFEEKAAYLGKLKTNKQR